MLLHQPSRWGSRLAIHIFFLHVPKDYILRKPTILHEEAARLDTIGTFNFLLAIICLLLVLEWGSLTYHWSYTRIVVLFILFGL